MKITTWNVNGIRAVTKKKFANSIKEINPDILCLQEIKAQPEQTYKELENLTEYKVIISSATKKGYSGTATLTKIHPVSVNYGIGIDEFDSEGRIIVTEFENFQLLNVYTPNAGQGLKRIDFKRRWNEAFLSFTKNLDTKNHLLFVAI